MSGVWVFKNGVVRLEDGDNSGAREAERANRKALVYIPSNEVITSYSLLEQHLLELGWKRYDEEDTNLLQFNKPSDVDLMTLISLPSDFSKFTSIHMYDIVIKNRNEFQVRNM